MQNYDDKIELKSGYQIVLNSYSYQYRDHW